MIVWKIPRLALAALAVAATVAMAATLPAPAAAQDRVNVRFSWKLKGEYAPLYLAQEQGLFKKANLDVTMGEGAGAQRRSAHWSRARKTWSFSPACSR